MFKTCIHIFEQLIYISSFYSIPCVSSLTFKCAFVGTSCHECFLDLVWFSSPPSSLQQLARTHTHTEHKHLE